MFFDRTRYFLSKINEISSLLQLQMDDDDAVDQAQQSISCDLCGTSFEEQNAKSKCMMGHKTPTSFKCEQCRLYFANAAQLGTHEVLFHAMDENDEEEDAVDEEEGGDDDDDAYEDSD